MKKVIVIGAGGHARVIADIIKCCGDEVVGFLDDRAPSEFPGMMILGKVSDARALNTDDVGFVIGIGNNKTRKRIAKEMQELNFYTAIHPSAVVARDVDIGVGTVVMANAVINTGSKVGCHCIINTAATVDHDNLVSDFAHLSPGVHLSGTVEVGEGTWLGTGAVTINNIKICDGCMVGAGAVVVGDIREAGTYTGIPATARG